ncbi:ALDH-like protein [Penicillium macrosclerotiorum]|uniref:ALDH-like protein n=1 Tax=Penicillium macrosclerotiorum TaxID=303699 RepID=UPI002547EDBF|nr:ALDH-like protein [Penicillium macrosclerotiorum]KAJ5675987.1 ALDH-like protein [Penicillium macrosclerotiorum]
MKYFDKLLRRPVTTTRIKALSSEPTGVTRFIGFFAMSDQLTIIPLRIGGKETASAPSIRFPVYCNAQQKDVYLAESADATTAKLAADAAQEAFTTWKKVPAVDRRELLQNYARSLRANTERLIAVQQEETSAPDLWCRKNIELAVGLVEETAACITSLNGSIPQTSSSLVLSLAFTVPIGPVLVIAPWNSPIILGARNIATAVAAGCTVVFKVSENCPQLHHLLVHLFEDAGLPKGIINVIQASREMASEVTEAVIAHQAIRKVEFVGSASVGRAIGQLCAKYLKPIFMELGGKGPAIVLEDADLTAAAKRCVLGERIIVAEKVASEFRKLLLAEVESFPVTDGVSPRIVEASRQKLLDAEKKGATFLYGGTDKLSPSKLRPTILEGVTKDMDIYYEEAFGPSVALFVARDDDHAIEIANDSPYGLNAAIHTLDFNRAWQMTQALDFGQIHVNNMTPHDEPTFPIGGVKGSGWGRNNALWGLREFSETKLMTWSVEGQKFV